MLKFLRKTALYVFLLPIFCGFTGMALNQAVLYANNDKFPVLINPVKLVDRFTDEDGNFTPPVVLRDGTIMIDDVHCVMSKQTHLNFLADNFDFHTRTVSIGDILIFAEEKGIDLAPYIWGLVLYARMRRREEQSYY